MVKRRNYEAPELKGSHPNLARFASGDDDERIDGEPLSKRDERERAEKESREASGEASTIGDGEEA